MKRLLLASLLAPGVASAGVVILDAKPATLAQLQQPPGQAKAPAPVLSVAQASVPPAAGPAASTSPAAQPAVPAAKPEPKEITIKAATPAAVIEPVQPAPTWILTAGNTVGHELQAWAKKAGWKVVWNMSKDWSVPASTAFPGDFKAAASGVIQTLAANGALVRAQFFDGNKTMVVTGPGVTPQ